MISTLFSNFFLSVIMAVFDLKDAYNPVHQKGGGYCEEKDFIFFNILYLHIDCM